MFKKKIKVGEADIYKEVIDWDAVFGTIFIISILLFALSKCS